MDSEEFKKFGAAALDFVADYLTKDARNMPVLPSVTPGYLHSLLPGELPENSENWVQVMEDFRTKIMPGITHWQSPNFHAYFTSGTSFPSIVGEVLSAGLGIVGFNWIASPACTELEVVVTNWLAKFLSLPSKFLSYEGYGGGIIQGSATEAILIAILTARDQSVRSMVEGGADEGDVRNKLVMYTSNQSNSCVERNAKLAGIKFRILKANSECVLTEEILEEAILEDKRRGLIPCICVATMGTTETCAFDDVANLALCCKRHSMMIYVDCAYAGAAFCLPDYSHHAAALENVDFFSYNLHKMMNVNYECSPMWFADGRSMKESFNVDRIYLENYTKETSEWAPDYRHWQIALGRRFRALKVWITLRVLGATEIRDGIRNRFTLAEYFERLLESDDRLEVVRKARMGLVVFRIRGVNKLTQDLLAMLNESKKIFLLPQTNSGVSCIRFVVCGFDPKREDMEFAFNEIRKHVACIKGCKSTEERKFKM